jgi:hypothetical protein
MSAGALFAVNFRMPKCLASLVSSRSAWSWGCWYPFVGSPFSLFVLAAYAALTSGFSGLGSVYDAIFAWVALQVGYFLAVLTYLVWPLLLERTVRGPPVEPKLKPRDRDETSPPNSSLPQ